MPSIEPPSVAQSPQKLPNAVLELFSVRSLLDGDEAGLPLSPCSPGGSISAPTSPQAGLLNHDSSPDVGGYSILFSSSPPAVSADSETPFSPCTATATPSAGTSGMDHTLPDMLHFVSRVRDIAAEYTQALDATPLHFVKDSGALDALSETEALDAGCSSNQNLSKPRRRVTWAAFPNTLSHNTRRSHAPLWRRALPFAAMRPPMADDGPDEDGGFCAPVRPDVARLLLARAGRALRGVRVLDISEEGVCMRVVVKTEVGVRVVVVVVSAEEHEEANIELESAVACFVVFRTRNDGSDVVSRDTMMGVFVAFKREFWKAWERCGVSVNS